MDINLPLEKMSSIEKLVAMEKLWDDLCHSVGCQSPDWHKKILEEREEEGQNKNNFSDWELAKNKIRQTLL